MTLNFSEHQNSNKRGLVIQGGGLRGVFAAGAVSALEDSGLTNYFDCVYGTSSGACCAAYFIAGQANMGKTIFYDDLCGWNFIQPWRPFKKMNLDFLIGKFRKGKKKLNIEALNQAKTDLKIYSTNALTARYEGLCKHDDFGKKDILDVIKSSCAYPGYYYPLPRINKIPYMDGNAIKLMPVDEAVNDGCDEIVLLMTVPRGYKESRRGILFYLFTAFLIMPLSAEVKKTFYSRIKNYNKDINAIFNIEKKYPNIKFTYIYPDYSISNIERDHKRLRNFCEHGYKKALDWNKEKHGEA